MSAVVHVYDVHVGELVHVHAGAGLVVLFDEAAHDVGQETG